jgi:hypothetical protein
VYVTRSLSHHSSFDQPLRLTLAACSQDKNAAAKRAFLRDSKGLTDAEIDEAVQRAAKQGPAPAPPQNVYSNAAGPPQQSAPQPSGPAAYPGPTSTSLVPVQAEPQPMRWSQIVLAVSVASAAAYGVATLVSPLVKRWWTGGESHAKEPSKESVALDRLMDAVTALTEKQADTSTQNQAVSTSVQKLQVCAARLLRKRLLSRIL